MSHDPTQKLDPKIKNLWRLTDTLTALLAVNSVCLGGAFVLSAIASDVHDPALSAVASGLPVASLVLSVAAVAVFSFIVPAVRYARWRYEVTADYLEIKKGIVCHKHTLVPFIRVQNTDTRRGPLMQLMGLASVTVSTAAGEHEIPGLSLALADELRAKTAEFARLAREDV